MSETRIRRIVGTRPAQVPESWTVWNAPRPIWGDIQWQQYLSEGWFCAAVDPGDPEGERRCTEYNQRMDACKVTWISEEDLRLEILTWAKEQDWYSVDIPMADIEATWEMNQDNPVRYEE